MFRCECISEWRSHLNTWRRQLKRWARLRDRARDCTPATSPRVRSVFLIALAQERGADIAGGGAIGASTLLCTSIGRVTSCVDRCIDAKTFTVRRGGTFRSAAPTLSQASEKFFRAQSLGGVPVRTSNTFATLDSLSHAERELRARHLSRMHRPEDVHFLTKSPTLFTSERVVAGRTEKMGVTAWRLTTAWRRRTACQLAC